MTLLEVGGSDGARRCDARCYLADGDECTCICGGANHGVGLERAVRNTYDLVWWMPGLQLPLLTPDTDRLGATRC